MADKIHFPTKAKKKIHTIKNLRTQLNEELETMKDKEVHFQVEYGNGIIVH